jgi:hypothetical protein
MRIVSARSAGMIRLAYLAWQALMLALVGALYLRWSAQRRVA